MKQKRSEKSRQIENKEVHYSLPLDIRTQEIMFRMSRVESPLGKLAAQIWEKMRIAMTEEPEIDSGVFPIPAEIAQDIDPALWKALLFEMEEERVCYGEVTPHVKEFKKSRDQLDRSTRPFRERMKWEGIKTKDELMTEAEKKESALYAELNTVTQDLARELGFERPVILEITRSPDFNAFILRESQEGGMEKDNNVALRVYLNAGLIEQAIEMMKADNKKLMRDHLAMVIGHEMAHLKQPGHHIDEAPKGESDEAMRFEYDADSMAFEAMDRAGYNPLAGIEFFEAMLKTKQSNRAGELVTTAWLRTHPMTETRIKELWQIYQRPDRPFFSAEKTFEPFSEDALKERDVLLRKVLHQKMDEAKTLEDWDEIIQWLEKDPKMTLKDAELVLDGLKIRMRARAAIAGAREMMERESGMPEAILYVANLFYQECKGNDQFIMINNTWCSFFQTLFPIKGEVNQNDNKKAKIAADKMLAHENPSKIRLEYDPQQARPEDEQKIVEYLYAHAAGNKIVENKPFTTMAELFDPGSPTAIHFWLKVLPAEDLKKLSASVGKEVIIIEKAKQIMMEKITEAMLYGLHFSHSYYVGADADEKEAFIKILTEARHSPAKKNAFMDAEMIGRAKTAMSHRLAGYRESVSSEERKKGKPYELNALLMNHSPSLPEDVLEPHAEIPETFTPLEKTLTRAFRASRKVFDSCLGPETLEREFGLKTKDDKTARKLLFLDQHYDRFFQDPNQHHSNQRFTCLPPEAIRAMPSLADYLRFIPATERDLLLSFMIRDMGKLKTMEDHGRHLEMIRTIKHNPSVLRISHSVSLPSSWRASLPADCLDDHQVYSQNLILEVKKMLFLRMVRLGILSKPGAKKKEKEEMARQIREALVSRATVAGFPADHYLGGEMGGLRAALTRAFGKIPEPEKTFHRHEISRFLSEEFMRLFADDAEEMEQCWPSKITLRPL